MCQIINPFSCHSERKLLMITDSPNHNAIWLHALKSMGCTVDASTVDAQIEQLKAYLELLQRWNKVYNLTAIRNPADMLPLHIYDSLAVLPYVRGKAVLDVGSGAGLPGIPLAIMCPDTGVVMLDSNGKKTRFIQQAIIQLKLDNTSVVHERIETFKPNQASAMLEHSVKEKSLNDKGMLFFDAIISRAFSTLLDFVSATSPFLSKSGVMYAMKGRIPYDEIKTLPADYKVSSIKPLAVPGVIGERHLIEIIRH